MKKILVVVAVLMLAAVMCYAADEAPKATTPVGAVVETGGVIIGKVTNVIERSLGNGKKEGSLIMADENGRTKIIPLDNTVKALDAGMNAITLNQLKGKKVSVSTEAGKATTVQEVK